MVTMMIHVRSHVVDNKDVVVLRTDDAYGSKANFYTFGNPY